MWGTPLIYLLLLFSYVVLLDEGAVNYERGDRYGSACALFPFLMWERWCAFCFFAFFLFNVFPFYYAFSLFILFCFYVVFMLS